MNENGPEGRKGFNAANRRKKLATPVVNDCQKDENRFFAKQSR